MSDDTQTSVVVTGTTALSHDHADETRTQVRNAIKAWLSGKSKHTVRASLGDLRLFASFVRGERVEDEIDAAIALLEGGQLAAEAAIADWREDMRDRSLQPTSIARRLVTLRSFVSTMRRFGLPWDLSSVRGPSYSPYARATGPETEELESKLDELDVAASSGDPDDWKTLLTTRDYAILVVLYHTGMRRSSLVDLTWSNTQLSATRPHVLATVKGGKTRRLPLSPRSVEALQRWRRLRVSHLGRYAQNDRVFCAVIGPHAGGSLTGDTVYKRLKYRHSLSGPHGVRHTTGTTVFDRSGSLKLAQEILGHANAATTQSYIDSQGSSAEEAMRVVAREEPNR